jgi:hypothetical protein
MSVLNNEGAIANLFKRVRDLEAKIEALEGEEDASS